MVAVITNPGYSGGTTDPGGQSIGASMNGIASAFLNTAQGDLQRVALQQAQQKQADQNTVANAFTHIQDQNQDYAQDAPDYSTPQPRTISLSDPEAFNASLVRLGNAPELGKALQFSSAITGGINDPGVAAGSIPGGGYAQTPEHKRQQSRYSESSGGRKDHSAQIPSDRRGSVRQQEIWYPPPPPEAGSAPAEAVTPEPPAIDPNLHGEDFLQTLPPQLQPQVRAIVEGRAPYPTGYILKTLFGQQLATSVHSSRSDI